MGLEAHVIRGSLGLAALTALALLVRSVMWLSQGAYIYLRPWATLMTAVILLSAAIAGLRGRTWGVLAAGVAATAFLGAAVLGIGPGWFVLVAAIAVAPTLVSLKRLIGFDARAAVLAISLALATGGIAALFAGPGLELLGFY